MGLKTFVANIFQTPAIAAALLTSVKKQKKFIRTHLQDDLDEAWKSNDGSLDASDLKKITDYYGLAIPAIVGEFVAVLRGFKLAADERKALTYFGAATGLLDDFFDKFHLPDEKIKSLMEQPSEASGDDSVQKLFLKFYNKALQFSNNKYLVKYYVGRIYKAQIDSKKQAAPGLTEEEIHSITIDKGGVSVLFYRAAMAHSFLPGEEEAFYEIGGLMQFGNDLFDIYKDRNDGIRTLATTANSIGKLRKVFETQISTSFASVQHMAYKSANKKKFLRLVSLCLCSRCFVVLDQLESKETSSGNIFMVEEYSRQDLVCDMDKKMNQWKSLKYHLKQDIKIPGTPKL